MYNKMRRPPLHAQCTMRRYGIRRSQTRWRCTTFYAFHANVRPPRRHTQAQCCCTSWELRPAAPRVHRRLYDYVCAAKKCLPTPTTSIGDASMRVVGSSVSIAPQLPNKISRSWILGLGFWSAPRSWRRRPAGHKQEVNNSSQCHKCRTNASSNAGGVLAGAHCEANGACSCTGPLHDGATGVCWRARAQVGIL